MPNVLDWQIVSAKLQSRVPRIAVSFALVRLSHCQAQKLETIYHYSGQSNTHSPRVMGGIIINPAAGDAGCIVHSILAVASDRLEVASKIRVKLSIISGLQGES
ncbi:hypothetical protein GLAREA_04595 [Glarea lozoyensis ATCC 20868]|uniref:Uncharacterized protein n=1 Tax=Glarea lozoyensis (strain ATCC 20868 / MF5171) TaxID=1116229 RepID=S3CRY0_GLAL2|nr:uncharacterized protein GLAREA_04595 [Glarea lozoyensis ATCC 20868]EPE27804.1 hypothetical protein GLAREA_04595 [Glarea lozoyensis ATCC 20868]